MRRGLESRIAGALEMMKWYHGTTEENMRSIRAAGLRKGTFVSSRLSVARSFAAARAGWNGSSPIVLSGDTATTKTRQDRSGRPEAVLLEKCHTFELMEIA